MRPDSELLGEFARSRDEAAFAELAARHAPMVYRACLRLIGDAHAAEDAVQAVFVILARKAASLRGASGLEAWLHGVARRVAHQALRERARRARREEEAAMIRAAEEGPAVSEPERRSVLENLDRELAALPAALRQAVILRYLEGRSQAEAAELAGCPQGTIARRSSQGLERLRSRLGRGGGAALSGAALAGLLGTEAVVAVPPGLLAAAGAAWKLSAAGAAGGSALALAEGAMRAMFWMKVKLAAAVVAGVTLVAGGGLAIGLAAGEPEKQLNPQLVNLAPNTWVKLKPDRNPVGRSYSGVRCGGGWLFYFGGGHGSHPGNDVELYAIAANSWKQVTEPEDWREHTKWTHAPEEKLASVKNIGGGSNAVGVTSPKGRPLVLHTYQMQVWVPEDRLFYQIVRGLGLWTFDPAKHEWKEVSKSLPGIPDVHTAGLLYDPELKTLVMVVSAGNDNGVHLWDREKKTWTRKADCPDRSWSEVHAAYDAARKLHVIRSGKRGLWWTLDTSTWKTKTVASLDAGESTSVDYDPGTKSVLCLKKANTASAGAPAELWAYDAEKDAWSELKMAGEAPAGICAWGLLNYDPEHKCHLLLNLRSVGGGMVGGQVDGLFAFRLKPGAAK